VTGSHWRSIHRLHFKEKISLTSQIFLVDTNGFPFCPWKMLTGTKISYTKLESSFENTQKNQKNKTNSALQ
jgi:hypothetical protein